MLSDTRRFTAIARVAATVRFKALAIFVAPRLSLAIVFKARKSSFDHARRTCFFLAILAVLERPSNTPKIIHNLLLTLRCRLNEHATNFINLAGEIHRICLQHFHRMTVMTFALQLCDTFVEGVQFVFQFLNFVLDRKLPSRVFFNGWSILGTC